MKDRTTLVIAHRLSTVQNPHQIALCSGGRIAGLWTQLEFLDKEGQFSSLGSTQRLAFEWLKLLDFTVSWTENTRQTTRFLVKFPSWFSLLVLAAAVVLGPWVSSFSSEALIIPFREELMAGSSKRRFSGLKVENKQKLQLILVTFFIYLSF